MRRIYLLSFVVLLFTLTACRSSLNSPQNMLSRNRNNWNDQGLVHYRFTFQAGCFCVPDFTRPVLIEVQNGVAVHKTYVGDGQEVTTDLFDGFDTVDELFEIAQSAIEDGADVIDIGYNPDYGYPEQISLDYIKAALDDEVVYRVLSFEPLP